MDISGKGVKESIPIVYKGGELKPGVIKIDGGLSSQFISALLIALPKLNNDSRIVITGTKIVSSDYIKMTRQVLSKAGIKIGAIGQRTLTVKGKQHFKPLVFDVPCDYGLAAFPLSAALLLKSNVVLKGNLDRRLIQSDGHIIAFLKKMGGRFGHTTKAITVKGPSVLKGGIFDLTDCPDLVPIMAVLALFAKGPTKLTGIMHARVKESDRISDLRRELLKVGAKVSETKGTLLITPSPLYKAGQVLNAHHDHRLAMAFTVLGLKIGCRVDGIESCAKSYPGFVKDMKTLGLGRI